MYRQTVPRCCGVSARIRLPEAVDRLPMRARQTRRHASVPVNQVSPPIRPTTVHVGVAAALGIHVHPPRSSRAREVVESRNCFGKAMVPLYQQTFPGTGLTVGPGDCVLAFPVALT